MTSAVLATIINSFVGIFLSGIYFAMTVMVLRTHRWTSAILPFITTVAYLWPTAAYVYAAINGHASTNINSMGLLLLILPALIVLQNIRRTKQDELDVITIITEMKKND